MVGTFVVRAAGFAYPLLAYHLSDDLRFNTWTTGRILAVFGGGWLLGSILLGWLADRFGRRSTLIGAMLVAAVTLPLLAQARTAPAVFATALVAGIVYDAPRPIVSAAIADLIEDRGARASANAWRHFAINVGIAVAGSAGGILTGRIGIPALIWGNGAACALFAVIAWRFVETPDEAKAQIRAGTTYRSALRDRRLWLLLIISLAALTCASGLYSSLPMLMADDGLTPADYGWTQAANAIAVLALSPVANRWLRRRADRPTPMTTVLAGGSVILGASMGAAGFASTTFGYGVSAVLAVPGEIAFIVAASDILNRISPSDARGLYAGVWGTTVAGSAILAPTLTSWSLTIGGDSLVAATIFAVGLLGAAMCRPLTVVANRPLPTST